MAALGSLFLYMLLPNPKRSFLFCLTSIKNLGMFYLDPIPSSMRMTAAEAPPCLTPDSAPVAVAIEVNTSTPVEVMCITIDVEQLLSCSA